MRLPHNTGPRSSGARFVLWLAAVLALSFSGGALAHQLNPRKVAACESETCRPQAVVQFAVLPDAKRFVLEARVLLGVLAATAFRLEAPKAVSFALPVVGRAPLTAPPSLASASPRAPPAIFE